MNDYLKTLIKQLSKLHLENYDLTIQITEAMPTVVIARENGSTGWKTKVFHEREDGSFIDIAPEEEPQPEPGAVELPVDLPKKLNK